MKGGLLLSNFPLSNLISLIINGLIFKWLFLYLDWCHTRSFPQVASHWCLELSTYYHVYLDFVW